MRVGIVLFAGFLALPVQQPPSQKYVEGQELRVCGAVDRQLTETPTCNTTLRVSSAGDAFDVVIPDAVRRELGTSARRMRGIEACFTGTVSRGTGVVELRVESPRGIELVSAPPAADFGAGAVSACEGNVVLPRVLKEQKPRYTPAAVRERVEGTVEMEAVVGTDGTIGAVRVLRSLHQDLDQAALDAVRQWKFAPGTQNGKPVPVLVDIEMTFTLRPRR